MTMSECRHFVENEHEHDMGYCVKCALKEEMNKCRTCQINNNKLKKATNRFPDVIVDLINSFNACKRCIKTIDLIKKEPDDFNMDELNLWYFVNLNPLPSRTVLNKQLDYDYQLERCSRGNWISGVIFYHTYQNWFNELWKPNTSKMNVNFTMMNILRIMFSINGKKYKLEYPTIFNEEFFRDNIFHYLNRNTTIRN